MFSLSTATRAQPLLPVEIQPRGPAYMPGEVIVKFKETVNDAEIADSFRQGGLKLIKHVQTPAMKDHGHIGLTHVGTPLSVAAAVRLLNNLPGVEFAQPNWVYTHASESNDPFYTDGSLWGMYGDDFPSPVGPALTTNPFGSQAEKAWAAGFTGSPAVCVGVVDMGVQTDHPDLAANIWTNPGEIPGNGIDDDGDGYVDDVHGWSSFNDNGNVYDAVEHHGTHVPGIIGAVGGNGIGVAGVNWNVTIIPGKFGQNGGGTTADALQAIDYMTTLKIRKGLNIVALNGSWGTGPGATPDQALLGAITRAAQAGILFIAAAMNNGTNTDIAQVYPACFDTTAGAGYDSVISIGAIDRNGNRASFSNFGRQTVDLCAPGVTINSTLPGNTYGPMTGTSAGAPHVAGAIALYASTHPAATAIELRNDLLTSGIRPLSSLEGLTVTGGTLDIGALVTGPGPALPAPATPANANAVAVSGGRVDLNWSDLSDNELGFAIERSTDGQAYILADTVGANLVTYSDRTVRPGSTHFYRIRAYNAGGSSDYVYAPFAVTTPQVPPPAAPSSLTASSPTRGTVNLAWSDRSNNEDIFQVERKTGSTGSWQVIANLAANTVKFTNTGLVSRTTYTYRVRAFNAAGPSAYSNEATIKAK